jgi:hypothetical protein
MGSGSRVSSSDEHFFTVGDLELDLFAKQVCSITWEIRGSVEGKLLLHTLPALFLQMA